MEADAETDAETLAVLTCWALSANRAGVSKEERLRSAKETTAEEAACGVSEKTRFFRRSAFGEAAVSSKEIVDDTGRDAPKAGSAA